MMAQKLYRVVFIASSGAARKRDVYADHYIVIERSAIFYDNDYNEVSRIDEVVSVKEVEKQQSKTA